MLLDATASLTIGSLPYGIFTAARLFQKARNNSVSTTELSEGSKRIAARLVTALTAESVLRACPAEPVLPAPTAHTVPTAPSSGPTAPALMYVYRVEGAAFDVLKWRSQETHVKLRALAAPLLADIRILSHDDSASYRAGFDRVLLTTHQRV